MSVRIGSVDPLAGVGAAPAASSRGAPQRCALGMAGHDCACATCEIAARHAALAGLAGAQNVNGLGDPVMVIEGLDDPDRR